MNIIQRHLQSNQANTSFKDYPRLQPKWRFFKFCFWLQWLQLQWTNVWQNISLSRLRMVSTINFLTLKFLLLSNINNFAYRSDSNMRFYHAQLLKLQGNAAKLLIFQDFVLGFALLLVLCQDKTKGFLVVQSMRASLKNALKQRGSKVKLTYIFEFLYHILYSYILQE